MADVKVIAVGNAFYGDDGIGAAVLEAIRQGGLLDRADVEDAEARRGGGDECEIIFCRRPPHAHVARADAQLRKVRAVRLEHAPEDLRTRESR